MDALTASAGALTLDVDSTVKETPTIASSAVHLHLLDLAHAEDAPIELDTAGANYLSISLHSEDASIGEVKAAVCAAVAARDAAGERTPPARPLSVGEVRLVYLTNQTGARACKPLTDLFGDGKSMREYDVATLSWILIKRKFQPTPRARREDEQSEDDQADEEEHDHGSGDAAADEEEEYTDYGAAEGEHTSGDTTHQLYDAEEHEEPARTATAAGSAPAQHLPDVR
jgi:hypothetical protein